ncbi:fungal-specific transcription factor domain-containing protein [Lipomyces starkeyi]
MATVTDIDKLTGLVRGSKAVRACLRCRRQKLKCDVQRPCTLCIRAGSECIPASGDLRRQRRAGMEQGRVHHNGSRRQVSLAAPSVDKFPRSSSQTFDWSSSSTMELAETAFKYHKSDGLETSITSALPGGKRLAQSTESPESQPLSLARDPLALTVLRANARRPSVKGVLAILPGPQPTRLLVDTYFDRVHWFMLVFHQNSFRAAFDNLYSPNGTGENEEQFGFACLVLTVATLGLQYTCTYRKKLLEDMQVEPSQLMEIFLSTLKALMLDIISLGSLESVQVCVLIGSFYLYHGEPGLAWPIFGCAQRITEALGLHRRLNLDFSKWDADADAARERQRYESRKRCWWALFEVDRFCSMVYGYSWSMPNQEYDVEFLDPAAKICSDGADKRIGSEQATLLSYKALMAELYVIITKILSEEYRPKWPGNETVTRESKIQSLISHVGRFDGELRNWYRKLPVKLRLGDNGNAAYRSKIEMERDIGAVGEVFEGHIFRMQALSLAIAYENAIILAHRPLLTFRLANSTSTSSTVVGHTNTDPFRYSFHVCRQAALRSSRFGSLPIFCEARDTYAVAFLGIHLFMACVTLALIASSEPLTVQAHEAKLGIQRLLDMQRTLMDRSLPSAQGYEIMKKLAKLVLSRELDKLLLPSAVDLNTVDGRNLEERLQRSLSAPSPKPSDDRIGDSAVDNKLTANPCPPLTLNGDGIEPTEQECNVPESLDTAESGPAPEPYFDIIEDTSMAQMLLDLDEFLLNRPTNDEPADEYGNAEGPISNGGSGLMELEQAWIWGIDHFNF